MKRYVSVLLSLAFVLSSVPPAFAANYAPGTYTGEGNGFGGKVTATIIISSDKVTSCTLNGNGETPAIGGAALPKLQEQVLAAGSADIDGVTGATLTSSAVKTAVAAALKSAKLEPVTSSVPPQAITHSAEEAANILYDLGLFSGTGTNPDGTPNFDLDRVPTRAEAVTMLVRLLGKEDEAKAGTWDIPFEDIADWAKPYVGYAYANGLTTGTGKTTFGGENAVTAAQYLTFVLRALGYTSGTDFQWDRPWELADQIGLTQGQYGINTAAFVRGDVAIISNKALSITQKGQEKQLCELLGIKKEKISPEDLQGVWYRYNDKLQGGTESEYIFTGSSYTYCEKYRTTKSISVDVYVLPYAFDNFSCESGTYQIEGNRIHLYPNKYQEYEEGKLNNLSLPEWGQDITDFSEGSITFGGISVYNRKGSAKITDWVKEELKASPNKLDTDLIVAKLEAPNDVSAAGNLIIANRTGKTIELDSLTFVDGNICYVLGKIEYISIENMSARRLSVHPYLMSELNLNDLKNISRVNENSKITFIVEYNKKQYWADCDMKGNVTFR